MCNMSLHNAFPSVNNLETDDTVLFVRRKGGIRIGLVTATFREENESDSDDEDEDSDGGDKDAKLTEGQSRVEWFPSGKDGCVKEEKAILLDRSLLIGETVSRPSKPHFVGFVKNVHVVLDVVLLSSKEWVLRGLDGESLSFINVYDDSSSTCNLLLRNWVGSLESSEERLMLRSKKHGYMCWMSSKHEEEIWDMTWKREQYCSFDNTQWFPGQTVKLPFKVLQHAQWIGNTPPDRFMKRIAAGSGKLVYFTVEKTELTCLNVRWLSAVPSSDKSAFSGYSPPCSKVEGEDLLKIRKLDHFEYQLTQIGDRVWVTVTAENVAQAVRYGRWMKQIESDFAPNSATNKKKMSSSSQKSDRSGGGKKPSSSVEPPVLMDKRLNWRGEKPANSDHVAVHNDASNVAVVGVESVGADKNSNIKLQAVSGDDFGEGCHTSCSSSTSSSTSSLSSSLAASQPSTTAAQRVRRQVGYLARRWNRSGAPARAGGVRLKSHKQAGPGSSLGGVGNRPVAGGRERRKMPLNEADLVKGKPTVGQRLPAEVIFAQSFLDVVWQNGNEEKGIPSRELAYFNEDLDEHAFLPGNFVQYLNDPSPCSHFSEGGKPVANCALCGYDQVKDKVRWPSNGFGIVDSVDAEERTASVKWFELIGQVEPVILPDSLVEEGNGDNPEIEDSVRDQKVESFDKQKASEIRQDFTLRFVPIRYEFGNENNKEGAEQSHNSEEKRDCEVDLTQPPSLPPSISNIVCGDVSVYDLATHLEMNFYPSMLVMRVGGFDPGSYLNPGKCVNVAAFSSSGSNAPDSAGFECNGKEKTEHAAVASNVDSQLDSTNPWVGIVLGVESRSGMIEVRWVSGMVDRVPPTEIIPVFRDSDGDWSDIYGEGEQDEDEDEIEESEGDEDEYCSCHRKKGSKTKNLTSDKVDGSKHSDTSDNEEVCDYCKSMSSWETLSQEEDTNGDFCEGEIDDVDDKENCGNNRVPIGKSTNTLDNIADEVFHDAIAPPVRSVGDGVVDECLTVSLNVATSARYFVETLPIYFKVLRHLRVCDSENGLEVCSQLRILLMEELVGKRSLLSKLFDRAVVFKHIRIAQGSIRKLLYALRKWMAFKNISHGDSTTIIQDSSIVNSMESLLQGIRSSNNIAESSIANTSPTLIDSDKLLELADIVAGFISAAPSRSQIRALRQRESGTSVDTPNSIVMDSPSLEKDSYCDVAWQRSLERPGHLFGSQSSSQDSLLTAEDGFDDCLESGEQEIGVNEINRKDLNDVSGKDTGTKDGCTVASDALRDTDIHSSSCHPCGDAEVIPAELGTVETTGDPKLRLTSTSSKSTSKLCLTEMFANHLAGNAMTCRSMEDDQQMIRIVDRTNCLIIREAVLGKTMMLGDFFFVLFFKTLNPDTANANPSVLLEKILELPSEVVPESSKGFLQYLNSWQLNSWCSNDFPFWNSLLKAVNEFGCNRVAHNLWETYSEANALAVVDYMLFKIVYLISYLVDQIAVEHLVADIFPKITDSIEILPNPAVSLAAFDLFRAEAVSQLGNAVIRNMGNTEMDELPSNTSTKDIHEEVSSESLIEPVLTNESLSTTQDTGVCSGSFELLEKASDGHHFLSKLTAAPTSGLGSGGFSKEFLRALRKEIDIMTTSLPAGIFVKGFEDRMDLFSAMLVGPDDTPFAGGLFYFDIQLPPSYPKEPPSVFYRTFASEQLNPNLYQDGKVCVSLLGTWSGKDTEIWNPGSNLLQVLVSIQGLILNAEPYFNEAGFETRRCLPESAEKSRRYNEMALLRNIESLSVISKSRPVPFEQETLSHLQLKGWRILETVIGWISGETVCSFRLQPVTKGFAMSAKRVVLKFEQALANVA